MARITILTSSLAFVLSSELAYNQRERAKRQSSGSALRPQQCLLFVMHIRISPRLSFLRTLVVYGILGTSASSYADC